MISDCRLVDPFYIYEDIRPGLLYRVEVIPRSNVDRAANGTPLSIDGMLTHLVVVVTKINSVINNRTIC